MTEYYLEKMIRSQLLQTSKQSRCSYLGLLEEVHVLTKRKLKSSLIMHLSFVLGIIRVSKTTLWVPNYARLRQLENSKNLVKLLASKLANTTNRFKTENCGKCFKIKKKPCESGKKYLSFSPFNCNVSVM